MENNTNLHTCPICHCTYDPAEGGSCTIDGKEYHCCQACADTAYAVCDNCGEIVPEEDTYTTHDGKTICESCYHFGFAMCEHCEEVYRVGDMQIVDRGRRSERWVCPDCLDSHYYECAHCGGYFSNDYIAMEDGDTCICRECCDYYVICCDCDTVVHIDDAVETADGWMCQACAPNHCGALHEYSYKPAPAYQRTSRDGSNALLYGVELEVDMGHGAADLAEELDALGAPIYCKTDGSLDCGLEVVTHPCTLAYHMERLPWDKIADLCREYDMLSHQANTCGLHVHIGRAQLGEAAADALTVLVCAIQYELTTLSRRSPSTLQRWAAINWSITPADLQLDDTVLLDNLNAHLLDSDARGRYQAVNRQNHRTVELRLWRGTLRVETLRATLQLVDVLCKYAQTHDLVQCARSLWTDVADTVPNEYTELLAYCTERGVYAPSNPA